MASSQLSPPALPRTLEVDEARAAELEAADPLPSLRDEIAVMNTLTVNLHLLMASFYRPTPKRFRILIDDTAFPSDSYAVQSQAALHRLDPSAAIVRVPAADVLEAVDREGDSLALALL